MNTLHSSESAIQVDVSNENYLSEEPAVKLEDKYNSLKESLKKLGKVVLAYSGGVDSTFLLKVAVDSLGTENVLACIGISASLAGAQYERAIECARIIGANLEEVKIDELSDSKYAANEADRCFHCKSHLFKELTGIAKEKGYRHIICGNNFDDLNDYRPGNRAVKLFGASCPLAEAEMTKDDIRELSRRLNLPTAEVPASPCLASRVSYGLKITEKRLEQIEQAEQCLTGLGFIEFRVRHHDNIARIELHPQDFAKITSEPTRREVISRLKKIGFKYVTIDLQGFRSGSLNELLLEDQKRQNL